MREFEHDSLCSCTGPIVWPGNGELRPSFNVRRYQHCLIARQHGLTECDITTGFIGAPDIACAVDAVRLVGKRLLDVSTLIAIKTTILDWSA